MKPKIILNNPPLDYELADLLNKPASDFIVLQADGKTVPFTGTPYDSAVARKNQQKLVDLLNDPAKWPDVFESSHASWCKHFNLPIETDAEDFHPKFSWAISRTCHGYSVHLHVAIMLFEDLADRLHHWSITRFSDHSVTVQIVGANGKVFASQGKDTARQICLAVKELLQDPEENNA